MCCLRFSSVPADDLAANPEDPNEEGGGGPDDMSIQSEEDEQQLGEGDDGPQQ